jgi:hypothetical protein
VALHVVHPFVGENVDHFLPEEIPPEDPRVPRAHVGHKCIIQDSIVAIAMEKPKA